MLTPPDIGSSMRALWIGLVYFGSFLIVGTAAKIAVRRWMRGKNLDLAEVQAVLGPRRAKRRAFLLGFWRNEEPHS